MAKAPPFLPASVLQLIRDNKLPEGGSRPFKPRVVRTASGADGIRREAVTKGPKRGKTGFVDLDGHIWIRDGAHAGTPDHWDVQIDGGRDYDRVGDDGNPVT